MELLFLTSYFPYNYGDTFFIMPETKYLSESFDKIHVINLQIDSLKYNKVNLNEKFQIVPFKTYKQYIQGKLKHIKSIIYSFPYFIKIITILLFEFKIINNKCNIFIIKSSVGFLLNAYYLSLFINKYLLQNPKIKLIYTYWYKYETLASLLCKYIHNIDIKCITRTHGADLYEHTQKYNYQPYKIWMDKYIDKVFFVSRAGYDYYISKFAGLINNKYIISKLGIENIFFQNKKYNKNNSLLNIISCSYMVPGKRIFLIIKALSKIDSIIINWTHIGDGPEKYNILKLSKNILSIKNNITTNFIGYLNNYDVKQYYFNNNIDCFISTTASEGGNPVSMMEAISFGIPVIASAVGGVPEIVNGKTGILLNPDNCVNELVNALYKISSMSLSETEALHKSCREYWENNYKAETQYPIFINHLKELIL